MTAAGTVGKLGEGSMQTASQQISKAKNDSKMEQSPDYNHNMSLLMQPSKMSNNNELDSVQEHSRKNDSSFLMQKAGPGVADDSVNMSPQAERMAYNVKPPRKVSVQRQ